MVLNILYIRRAVFTTLCSVFLCSLPGRLLATDYYVDATKGDDICCGTQSQPWKTLSRINSGPAARNDDYSPGDRILLKRGEVWREQLNPPSSGLPESPIVFGAYGDDIDSKGNPIRNPEIIRSDVFNNWWEYSLVQNGGMEYYSLSHDLNPDPNLNDWKDGLFEFRIGAGCSILADPLSYTGNTSAKASCDGNDADFKPPFYGGNSTTLQARISGVKDNTTYYFRVMGRVNPATGGTPDDLLVLRIKDNTNNKSLDSTGNWIENGPGVIVTTRDWNDAPANEWTLKEITFVSENCSPECVYTLELFTFQKGDAWIDDMYFVEANAPNQAMLWAGKRSEIYKVEGAMRDGSRIPLSSASNSPFESGTGSFLGWPSYFWYRTADDSNPGPIEIGARDHTILIDGKSHVVIENINATGPGAITNISPDCSCSVTDPQDPMYNPTDYDQICGKLTCNVMDCSLSPPVAIGRPSTDSIQIANTSNDIRINNVEVSNSHSHGICTDHFSSNIHYIGVSAQDNGNTGIYLNSQGGSVINSKSFNNCNIANDKGDCGGIGSFQGSNITISDNEVYHNGPVDGVADFEISVVAAQTPFTVTRNFAHDCIQGCMQIASGGDDSEISYNILNGFSTTTHDGLREDNPTWPISSGSWAGLRIGNVKRLKVLNNVISGGQNAVNGTGNIVSDCNTPYNDTLSGIFVSKSDNTGFIVKNNIFHGNFGKDIFVCKGSSITDFSFTHNIYFKPNLGYQANWHWIGREANSIGEWQQFSSLTTNSQLGEMSSAVDPEFGNASGVFSKTSDFKPTAGSPAINSGTNVGLITDFSGSPIVGPPDIGAFEFLPDADGDGITDSLDNCLQDSNPNQSDEDSDGIGNVCDTEQLVLTSIASEDGWVKESSETSNVGGSSNSTGAGKRPIRFGDNYHDRQYKAIVSFDTSFLPAGSTVQAASLELTRGRFIGDDPYSIFGVAWVDLSVDGFGGNPALNRSDFEAPADAIRAGQLTDDGTLATATLNETGQTAIEGSNQIQLRIAFDVGDNDDSSDDYTGYYSGDNSDSGKHPRLVIDYTLDD